MTILHMETDIVQSLASQIKHVSEDLHNHSQTLNKSIQSTDWMGQNRDEFINETDNLRRQLIIQLDSAKLLAEKLDKEIAKWEETARGLGDFINFEEFLRKRYPRDSFPDPIMPLPVTPGFDQHPGPEFPFPIDPGFEIPPSPNPNFLKNLLNQ